MVTDLLLEFPDILSEAKDLLFVSVFDPSFLGESVE
jgi:hypothetical protein